MRLLALGGDTSCARGLQGAHYQLLEEFHHYWDEINYLCPYHPQAKPVTLFENVHFHPAPRGRWQRVSWLKQQGLRLAQEKPHHLIGAHEYFPFFNGQAARWLTRKTQIPHILEIYHIEGYPRAANFKEWLSGWLAGFYFHWVCSQARGIRVINQKQVPDFLKNHGVDPQKIHLIYSSYTNFDIFFPQAKERDIDVLFVGRLVPNKGIKTLLQALSEISPSPRACLVGTGPLKSSLENWVQKKGLSSSITFHGWARDAQEIASLMNRSICLVCCSLSEGGPRTTLEAMACEVPIISTPVGTMPDIITHRVNGLFCNFDKLSLKNEIQWLLSHPQKAQVIGKKGRESILSFERKALIKNYAMTYQKLAQNKL